ncbi:hypothetical protein [Lachnoclostridium sp. An14]|uniref:hypothetical protein n=1 Tax=Lachnoclostridium sp. An14 TaxID=1965562 RepID=UPI0013A68399|nr:hypothetical protein [Lachnoclostridium sp. An14]
MEPRRGENGLTPKNLLHPKKNSIFFFPPKLAIIKESWKTEKGETAEVVTQCQTRRAKI